MCVGGETGWLAGEYDNSCGVLSSPHIYTVKDFQLYIIFCRGKKVTYELILKYMQFLYRGKTVYNRKSLTLANSVMEVRRRRVGGSKQAQ